VRSVWSAAVFPALLGPGEADELRWYLEKFVIRPTEQIRNRTDKVPERLNLRPVPTWTGEKDSQKSGYDDDEGSIRSLGSMLIRDNDGSA
jgi:hypothetical protein